MDIEVSAPGTVKGITDGSCSPRVGRLWELEGVPPAEAMPAASDPDEVDRAGEGTLTGLVTAASVGLWWFWLLGETLKWDSLDLRLVATPEIMPMALDFRGRFTCGEAVFELSGGPKIQNNFIELNFKTWLCGYYF